MIPAQDMGAYRAQLSALSARARAATLAALRHALDGADPAALDIAGARDDAVAAVNDVLSVYAVAGASVACDFSERHGLPPQTLTDIDSRAVERVVRYQAGKLSVGDVDGFIEQVGSFAADSVYRAANGQQMSAAQRGRKARGKAPAARFARVPSGAETCTFCRMLASRGFVYWSRETAGELDHFHRNCDCLVIASNDPDGIEGYDPDREYALWRAFEEIDADRTLSKEERVLKKRSMLNGAVLTSAEAAVPGPGEPALVDGLKFDSSSEDGLRSFTDMALREFDGLDVEHALILSKDGSVYRAIGSEDAVSIGGVDLVGSCIMHNHPNGGADAPTFSTSDYFVLCQHQDIKLLTLLADGRIQYIRPLRKLSESLYQEVMVSLPIPDSDGKTIEELVWEEMSKRGYIDFGWKAI